MGGNLRSGLTSSEIAWHVVAGLTKWAAPDILGREYSRFTPLRQGYSKIARKVLLPERDCPASAGILQKSTDRSFTGTRRSPPRQGFYKVMLPVGAGGFFLAATAARIDGYLPERVMAFLSDEIPAIRAMLNVDRLVTQRVNRFNAHCLNQLATASG